MIGMLQRREVDISVQSMTVTVERARAVDFMSTILKDQVKLFVQASGRASLKFYDTFYAFTSQVWSGLVIVCIAIFLLTLVFHRSDKMPKPLQVDIENALAFALRASIMKGYSTLPKRLKGKVLVMTALLFGLAMLSLFRGSLLSKLAVRRMDYTVNSLEDVLREDYDISTSRGTAFSEYFSQAPEGSVRKQLWNKKRE